MASCEELLDFFQVQGSRIYALGCFGSRLTFSSQQCRAFNLIWALLEKGRLKSGDRLAIVGAGLAGVTAATAAITRGLKVTVFEQASQPMAVQRGNFVRYIHPNILVWPDPQSVNPKTHWDIANWEAAPLATIVQQIDQTWNQFADFATTHYRYRVDQIVVHAEKLEVFARAMDLELPPIDVTVYEAVIVAVGFGFERTLEGIPSRSYWLNDDLHQEARPGATPRRILVSGVGDGGLIDVLRLRIRNFDHSEFVKDVLSNDDLNGVRERLLEIEAAVRGLAAPEANCKITEAYQNLSLNESAYQRLVPWLRLDTEVILNGPWPSPAAVQSSILHRYIAFLLWSRGHLHYRQGRILSIGSGERYSVNFDNGDGTCEVVEFDDVIVRHGPEPVVQRLIEADAVRQLCRHWQSAKVDLTLEPSWPSGYFAAKIQQLPARDPEAVAVHVMQRALAQIRHLVVVGIRVGLVESRIGYIVTLGKPVPEPELPKTIESFPVRFEVPLKLPRAEDVPAPTVLRPGAWISCGELRQAQATLGCFVLTHGRQIGFVTTGHGFVPEVGPEIGAPIFHATSRNPTDPTFRVGKLSAFLSPTEMPANSDADPPVLNMFDIALGVLSSGVRFKTTIEEHYAVPPLVGMAKPERGDRVYKVGARTGRTVGIVTSVSAQILAQARANPIWLINTFAIEPEGPTMFSHEGDSGALILRDSSEGALVLGMLVGSDRRRTSYGLPLQPALEALNCRMIFGKTFEAKQVRLC